MSSTREREIIRTFVSVANDLANGVDVVDVLSGLTTSCASLLDVASAGLLLADRRGTLHVLAASNDATRVLELFQLQSKHGPCLDCYRDGAPVSIPDLSTEIERWPQFVAAARIQGSVSVHAVPLCLQGKVLGTLGLFGGEIGALTDDDLALAQALADVASVALLQDRTATDSATLAEQLQNALDSRVIIEQAKGVIAQTGGFGMDRAFAFLRRYARDHNLGLTALATTIVDRGQDPDAQAVVDHGMAKGSVARAAP